jgi:predicted RNase H-like HicB family nuclease
MRKGYLVLFEPTATGFCAYSPDLPGCVTTGATRQEAENNIREALYLHVDGLLQAGRSVPRPRIHHMHVDVAEILSV